MSGRRRPTRKRRAELSQHFLRESTGTRLVQATSISRSDLVVEIGPGRGALTRSVARQARRLIAVELDSYLAEKLRHQYEGKVEIVTTDFLAFDLPTESYCVIGNIPYAKSTEIVRKLVDVPCPPMDAWLIVQREFANRMCGLPYSNETLWSLRLKPFWHLEIVDRLKKTDFDPPPSVESVFLRMCHRSRPIVSKDDAERYLEFIRTAFGRGATISQALRPMLSKIQVRRLASDLRFRIDDNPAMLMFEQWLGIFRFLERARPPKK